MEWVANCILSAGEPEPHHFNESGSNGSGSELAVQYRAFVAISKRFLLHNFHLQVIINDILIPFVEFC
jgi:hypothetical protein